MEQERPRKAESKLLQIGYPMFKRTYKICSLMLALLGLNFPALAQSSQSSATNGCGTGWSRPFVPDRIKFLGCEFKNSCDLHDVCYGSCELSGVANAVAQCQYLRCELGGDLHGKPICDGIRFTELRTAANIRRAECDAKFLVDLTKANPKNASCTFFTGFYPFMVRILGNRAFLGIDAMADIGWSEVEKTAYVAAISKLLETWPAEKIADLGLKIRNGTADVDLLKQIKFDSEKGLINE